MGKPVFRPKFALWRQRVNNGLTKFQLIRLEREGGLNEQNSDPIFNQKRPSTDPATQYFREILLKNILLDLRHMLTTPIFRAPILYFIAPGAAWCCAVLTNWDLARPVGFLHDTRLNSWLIINRSRLWFPRDLVY